MHEAEILFGCGGRSPIEETELTKFSETGVIIREHHSQALGTLGADTVILLGTNLAMLEDFRMLKALIAAHITGLIGGEGQGLFLGIANGALSVGEIKACLEADGPVNRSDRTAKEFADRMVHLVGSIEPAGQTAGAIVGPQGGSPYEMKFRWTYSNSDGWQWFIYNSGPVLTTGAAVTIVATNYGVWL